MLRVWNGALVNTNGEAYNYVPSTLFNNEGLIAYLDAEVGAQVLEVTAECTTTRDITRDADGQPIDGEI